MVVALQIQSEISSIFKVCFIVSGMNNCCARSFINFYEYKKQVIVLFDLRFLLIIVFLLSFWLSSPFKQPAFNEKSFVTLSSVSSCVCGTVHHLSECMSTTRAGIGLQYAWRWAHSIVLVLFSPWSPDNYPRFYRLTLLNRASLIFIECQLVLHCDVPTLGSHV